MASSYAQRLYISPAPLLYRLNNGQYRQLNVLYAATIRAHYFK